MGRYIRCNCTRRTTMVVVVFVLMVSPYRVYPLYDVVGGVGVGIPPRRTQQWMV